VWQLRGRRAWEDAQTAASGEGGALEGVMVAAPPVAGVAAFAPLVASAPFERLPGEEECGAAGEPVGEPASPGGGLLLRYALRDEPHWTESFPGREPRPGEGLIRDPIPENPPLREGMTGREPTLGDGLISDPAQQPCGRQQVNDESRNEKGGGSGQSDGQTTGRRIVTTPQGDSYDVPKAWVLREADNGRGIVYQELGAAGNANSIRIMEPTPRYPHGYVRYYNGQGNGQPLDVNGDPGPPSGTHITARQHQGPWPGWPTS